MNMGQKCLIGFDLLRVLAGGRRKPLFVSWQITEKCNLNCRYCGSSRKEYEELPTARCEEIIRDLRALGTRVIRFTGGEPLLRKDLPELVWHCHSQGLWTGIATNGILFPDMMDSLRGLSAVSFSLDGPAEIHDSLRGQGAHAAVLKALEKAKTKRLYTTLSVSISRQNEGHIDYVLDLAKKFSVKAFFQPVTKRAGTDPKCGCLSPDPVLFRGIMERLIKEKRHNRFIGNSEAGLRHLSRWPEETAIPCLAGRAICRIGPDGQLYACTVFRVADPALSVAKRNMPECFNGLASCHCKECWCSLLVELNMLGKWTPKAILDAVRG